MTPEYVAELERRLKICEAENNAVHAENVKLWKVVVEIEKLQNRDGNLGPVFEALKELRVAK